MADPWHHTVVVKAVPADPRYRFPEELQSQLNTWGSFRAEVVAATAATIPDSGKAFIVCITKQPGRRDWR